MDDYIEILETMEKASGKRMAQKVEQAVKFASKGVIEQLGKKSFAEKVCSDSICVGGVSLCSREMSCCISAHMLLPRVLPTRC
jgi:hypothetical protein